MVFQVRGKLCGYLCTDCRELLGGVTVRLRQLRYYLRHTNGIVEYPVNSVNGSGTSAEITNVSLSGAHSDFPDVILSGFSFTKGTKAGSAAQATALAVAVKDRTGELDINFNGTGELITKAFAVTRDLSCAASYSGC
jgi:hypothetical protein